MENSFMSCSANSSLSNSRKDAFRNILNNVINLERENIADNTHTIRETSHIVRDLEKHYNEKNDETLRPVEYYLGSKVMCATSVLAVRCSSSVDGNLNKYDKSKLASHMGSNPDYWEFPFPHEVQPVSYLYGTFSPTPPEKRLRPPRRRTEKQKAAAMKMPKTKQNVEETVKDAEMVKKVHKFVQKACRNGPLCYFKLALDPTSFTKTIENIYHLSFLVAEGVLEISIDDGTGLPLVRTRSADSGQGGDNKNQFILSMDMQLYNSLIKAFGIREPMMVIDRIEKNREEKRN